MTDLGTLFADAEIRGEITAVRLASDADVDMLVDWHAEPGVARYWDGETFTRGELLDRLHRRDVAPFIVEVDNRPVGYLQVWREGDEAGLDMFLLPAARGRSFGPDAARAVARHLRDRLGWPRVTVDPYLWNEAAVRAWQRAGFRPIEEREPDTDHTARWLLMDFAG